MIYTLEDGADKILRIADGRLNLLLNGVDEPLYAADMRDMITLSFQRPWKISDGSFQTRQIHCDHTAIEVQGQIGQIDIALRFLFDENNLLRVRIRFQNPSNHEYRTVSAGFLMPLPEQQKRKLTLPMNLYNNNPSADPARLVPHIGKEEGCGYICEEHRLPVPCVNVEWLSKRSFPFLSLFSLPSKIEAGKETDHFWSLGAAVHKGRLTLAGMSGVLLFNGCPDRVYGFKNKVQPYDSGYFDFPAGAEIQKDYVLDWGVNPHEGRGFRNIAASGYKLYKPCNCGILPVEKVIGLKTNAMDNRWFDDGDAAGYLTFPGNTTEKPVNNRPPYFLYGWTGQCLKIAWCNAKIGIGRRERSRIENCKAAVDFYLKGSQAQAKGLRYTTYLIKTKEWVGLHDRVRGEISSRMVGENTSDIADIILLFRRNGHTVPSEWTDSLRDTADFLTLDRASDTGGIYPLAWTPQGNLCGRNATAAGISCAVALVRAFECTKDPKYLKKAEEKLQIYYDRFADTFEYPFAWATLDARCEDKEAGISFFLASYELYHLTGQKKYADWAALAADWLLTFVYFWNTGFPQGTPCARHHFDTTGWTGVSVQNHHLDVFFPSYELWHFGYLTENAFYKKMGRTIFGALSQGICTRKGEWNFLIPGEQGEQYYQTNWSPDPLKWRGGFNTWNPSWIVAQVLKPALMFQDADSLVTVKIKG